MYRKDRDVVYLNKLLEEEKRALPEEIRKTNDEIHSSMLKFLMKQNEYFRSKKETYVNKKDEKEVKSLKEKRLFFEEVIKNIRKRNSNLLEIFELWRIRCLKDPKYTKKNSRGLTLCLSTSRNNIKLVSTEAQKDLILRRNLALLIKKTRREIDDINNKEFKTYLVPKYKLDKRQENNYEFGFNLETIRKNINIPTIAGITERSSSERRLCFSKIFAIKITDTNFIASEG